MIRTLSWLRDAIENAWACLTGILLNIVGYLVPVKNIVHVVLLFFVLDAIFGYWAAKKLRGEGFNAKIFWHNTAPRALISVVLIILTYLWDTVFMQDYISTYKFVGWFISGVLLFSIAKNGFQITKWGVFNSIGNIVKKKVEETGEKIEDNESLRRESNI